ncbi:DUF4411 family protein [Piscinibacterium candidicorallinum]|uniref:DUF4411 family protein n=1 Tax=Piscinibacterium candidicorallinum TaxID=1793872 RepID=A0ABV7H3D7_9BURK
MLYLLDASVLITAKDNYYPLDAVPEYWDWLQHLGESGQVKIPLEIWEEIKEGPKDAEKDLLYEWIQRPHVKAALLLDEEVDPKLVQRVTEEGYATDLTEDEIEQLGRDPFLIAYGLAKPNDRVIVTSENSAPGKKRANRKVPDVCLALGVQSKGPFELNRELKFSTRWREAAAR